MLLMLPIGKHLVNVANLANVAALVGPRSRELDAPADDGTVRAARGGAAGVRGKSSKNLQFFWRARSRL